MECPHINDCIKITAPQNPQSEWSCSVCSTNTNPWLCLTCGVVNCGSVSKNDISCSCLESKSIWTFACPKILPQNAVERAVRRTWRVFNFRGKKNQQFKRYKYVNGHGLEHYNTTEHQHRLCMDCDSLAVFCYACDEFVINEATLLEEIRKHLQTLGQAASAINHKNHEKETEQLQQLEQRIVVDTQNCQTNHNENNENSENNENRENEENEENAANCSRRRKASESAEFIQKKIKTEDNKVKIKPKSSGLRNLGNTCFMNAVLQSLSNIQSFCGYIKQLPSLENKVAKKKLQTRAQLRKEGDQIFLIEELRKTLVALWQREKAAISPESLFSVIWKVVPRFRGYQQQDAHEFMRYLLDRLHTELLTLIPYPNNDSIYIGPKGKSTIVTAIFGGILQNEVRCLVCGMESKKHDPFLDLSLDIPVHFSSKSAKLKDGENPPMCRLSDCLSSFTDIEELEDSELYRCSQCKQKQRSTKRFWIRRLPNVLCLHLKRFRWNSYFRIKVDTYVDFPIRGLSMDEYVLGNLHETRNSGTSTTNEYDLAACIVHHGSGAGSGHYTSYACHEGRWYHFNDSTVTVCDEETVKRAKVYIMFYVRRHLRLPEYLKSCS